MSIDKAIEILTEELRHIRLHLQAKGKAPEHYEELGQLARAMEMGITALKELQNEAAEPPKDHPAPICQTCGNFEVCAWHEEGIFSGPKDKARRVVACSDYKRAL